MTTAQIILNQFGGRKFIAMTGAMVMQSQDGMTAKFKGSAKATHVKVTLCSDDTYKVEFFKIRGTNVANVCEFDGVYSDMLRPTFEKVTGLYTSL